jgi:hypothetical protein
LQEVVGDGDLPSRGGGGEAGDLPAGRHPRPQRRDRDPLLADDG